MISIAKERFDHLPNFNYLIEDYSKKLPENKYDLIASALSIHHLTESEKFNLYKNVYHSLNGNGFFLNIDQYNSQNNPVEKRLEDIWVGTISRNFSGVGHADFKSWKERRKLDKETTIENEIQKLKKIGFRDVDCLYKYWKFGVVIAKKIGRV
jgi:tRNA (cmo5U34)-methyltransferase